VELDLKGNLIGRWRLEFSRTVTLAKNGHVYAQNTNSRARELLLLDRTLSVFKRVEGPNRGVLYGADGDELVFGEPELGPIHFRWYQQP
jgi:hypothetical protein